MFISDALKWWLSFQSTKFLAFYSELWFVSTIYKNVRELSAPYFYVEDLSTKCPLSVIHAPHQNHSQCFHDQNILLCLHLFALPLWSTL